MRARKPTVNGPLRFGSAQVKALRIDSQRHDANLLARNTEIARHEIGVILADRKKRIDVFDLIANQIQRLAAIWFLQAIEKQIFALQRAKNRHVQRLLERRSQAEQQRVRKIDDVRRCPDA